LEMVHCDLGFDRSGDETGHVLCSIAVIATASISIRYPGRARTETAIAVTDSAIVLRQISASKSLPHKHSLVSGFGVASRHLVRTDKACLPSSAVLAKRARRCRAQRADLFLGALALGDFRSAQPYHPAPGCCAP